MGLILSVAAATVSCLHAADTYYKGQKVTMLVPPGYKRWTVADDCTIARLLLTNTAYRTEWAVGTMKRHPELTYAARASGTIGEVDPDGTCVRVEVHGGPSGWVHTKSVELKPGEKHRFLRAAIAAEAHRKATEAAAQQVRAVAVTERVGASKPLQLLDFDGSYDSLTTTITGSVRNNTSKRYRYAEIRFTLFDEDGSQIDTAFANISDLEPAAVWKFKAVGLSSGRHFKLASLSGW